MGLKSMIKKELKKQVKKQISKKAGKTAGKIIEKVMKKIQILSETLRAFFHKKQTAAFVQYRELLWQLPFLLYRRGDN